MYLDNVIDLYTKVVDKIWSTENIELNKSILKAFSDTIRPCSSEYLAKVKAFPVINNNLIANTLESFGCNDLVSTGLYQFSGKCTFLNRLVIPLYGFDEKVHGFVGYDNGNDISNTETAFQLIPYLYLQDIYFKKEKYWFMTRDEYKQALENQYICIVDGIFDKILLQSHGYPATSLLGSSLSRYHRDYLKYIKNWIVFSDSDIAGNQLFSTCKKYNQNTIQVKVGNGAKDIDERLRDDEQAVNILDKLFNTLANEHYFFNHSVEEFASKSGK